MADGLDPQAVKASPAPEAEVSQALDPQSKTQERASYAAVVERAKKRFEYVLSVDDHNRKEQKRDTQFAWERGAQWNEEIRRKRETSRPPRPWLEFNQTGPYIKRITNDQRQNKPAIRLHPARDGATEDKAKLYEGLVRAIEYWSDAKDVYMLALEHAATGGRGYWRIVTEYESEDSFNQVLCLKPVANPLSVYLDPDAIAPDKSDAKYGFVCEWIDKDTYEREWPGGGNAISWDSNNEDVFLASDKVCVADYYECVDEEVELVALSDGRTMWSDAYDHMLMALPQQAPSMMGLPSLPPQIVRSEKRKRTRVDWYKLTARAEPLEVYEWLGKYIPIVQVTGDEIDIDGKKIYQGVIRRLRDAQMMYNYWFTLATERIALAPRAPWVGAAGQFEGHSEWDDANTENHPYLEYEFVKTPDGQWVVQAPTRTEPIPVDQGLITMLQLCAQNLREITGQRDAETPNPNVPWRAILAEQRKGDLATYHYGDNLAKAIEYTGRILEDLIPKVWDTQRAVMLVGEDGTMQQAVVNQQVPNTLTGQVQTLNDLRVGRYEVAVDVGPSYATKRMEAVADMRDFMEAMGPQVASMIGDLFAKQADWPGDIGEQVSARLFSLLPPNVQALAQASAKGQNPQVVALQQAMQGQQQQFQQQMQQARDAFQKLTQENEKLQSALYRAQAQGATIKLQAEKRDQSAQADVMTQVLESKDVQAQTENDRMETIARVRRDAADIGLKRDELQLQAFKILGDIVAKLGPMVGLQGAQVAEGQIAPAARAITTNGGGNAD